MEPIPSEILLYMLSVCILWVLVIAFDGDSYDALAAAVWPVVLVIMLVVASLVLPAAAVRYIQKKWRASRGA
jgi:hypothetical protein